MVRLQQCALFSCLQLRKGGETERNKGAPEANGHARNGVVVEVEAQGGAYQRLEGCGKGLVTHPRRCESNDPDVRMREALGQQRSPCRSPHPLSLPSPSLPQQCVTYAHRHHLKSGSLRSRSPPQQWSTVPYAHILYLNTGPLSSPSLLRPTWQFTISTVCGCDDKDTLS